MPRTEVPLIDAVAGEVRRKPLTADAGLLGSLAASARHITEDVQGTVAVEVGTDCCAGGVGEAGTVTDRLAKCPDRMDDFRVGLGSSR